jgi:hypothetical protein
VVNVARPTNEYTRRTPMVQEEFDIAKWGHVVNAVKQKSSETIAEAALMYELDRTHPVGVENNMFNGPLSIDVYAHRDGELFLQTTTHDGEIQVTKGSGVLKKLTRDAMSPQTLSMVHKGLMQHITNKHPTMDGHIYLALTQLAHHMVNTAPNVFLDPRYDIATIDVDVTTGPDQVHIRTGCKNGDVFVYTVTEIFAISGCKVKEEKWA